MTKPTGDRVLLEDPAEIWRKVDLVTTENSAPILVLFAELVRRMPIETKTKLQEMWEFEYEARDDGGRGHSALDHLWQAFDFLDRPQLMDRPQLSLCGCDFDSDFNALAWVMEISLSYAHAMERALRDAGIPDRATRDKLLENPLRGLGDRFPFCFD